MPPVPASTPYCYDSEFAKGTFYARIERKTNTIKHFARRSHNRKPRDSKAFYWIKITYGTYMDITTGLTAY